MKILLINPPHTAIGSRVPGEHLPPLGLMAVGGPLIDAGHDVSLLDGEFYGLRASAMDAIIAEAVGRQPEVVLMGHSGSTSADCAKVGCSFEGGYAQRADSVRRRFSDVPLV